MQYTLEATADLYLVGNILGVDGLELVEAEVQGVNVQFRLLNNKKS